jgi:hypothetical protein
MNNFRKPSVIISKILFALLLALTLISVTSCDDMLEYSGTEEPTNPQGGQKNHYSDYVNFNPADYPIINESGKSDSAIADLKDIIWLMYAEREDVRDWTANYVKSNKIKTILSNDIGGVFGAVKYNQLDRFYLNEDRFYTHLSFYEEYDDYYRATLRKDLYGIFTHETMHIVQHKSGALNLMTGMRPDICAATNMLMEYLAWFYSESRYPGTDITADMKDAIETQSKYMVLSTDPWEYDDARAKDPSLPPFIHSTPWFINDLNFYTQHAFTYVLVHESAMTAPLRQASKEDMLKIARALLACRDPKMAGVTDEALWTVFDALRRAAVGDSKYFSFGGLMGVRQDLFDNFQAFIAEWDAAFAAQ